MFGSPFTATSCAKQLSLNLCFRSQANTSVLLEEHFLPAGIYFLCISDDILQVGVDDEVVAGPFADGAGPVAGGVGLHRLEEELERKAVEVGAVLAASRVHQRRQRELAVQVRLHLADLHLEAPLELLFYQLHAFTPVDRLVPNNLLREVVHRQLLHQHHSEGVQRVFVGLCVLAVSHVLEVE